MRKIDELRERLRKKHKAFPHKKLEKTRKDSNTLKAIFTSQEVLTSKKSTSKDLKIIGITGSKGKSTTAYIIHNYLKALGYKVVLYSSITIDSPLSYAIENEAIDNPLRDEDMLLSIIEEAIEYEADYLIMEVNEKAIKNNLTKDIPFDVRVITNIMPNHNRFFYNDYVDIKKSFFKEASEDTILVSPLINKETIELRNEINSKNYVTFSTNYISNVYKLQKDKDPKESKESIDSCIDYLLLPYKVLDTMEGLQILLRSKDNNNVTLESNLIMPYNALNIVCCYAVLDSLNVLNINKFKEVIKTIVIPGRDEVINYNNRKIIISLSLSPQLENLKLYQERKEINDIIVVSGTSGLEFKTWVKEFEDDVYLKEKEDGVRFAYNYIRNNSDIVYITTSDSGGANKNELLVYQKRVLNKDNSFTEIDRKEAIRKAIMNSKEKDVIYISGRGNRRIMCDTYESVKLLLDKDVVLDIIQGGEENE